MKSRAREMIIGQVIGQIALLLAIPFLTRLLAPSEMGIYQTAYSVALIIQPIATLRRELLIPFSAARDARRHRRTGLVVAGSIAIVVALLAVPAWWVGYPGLPATLVTTAFILMAFALMQIENAFLIRHGANGRLAVRNLAAGLIGAILQVAVAVWLPTAVSIALAFLVGRLIATLATVVRLRIVDEPLAGGERKSQRSVSAILSAVIAGAASQAIIIVSFGFLGPAAAAQVGLGQRIGGAPASLIGQALSQIALSSAAPLIRERRPGLSQALRKQTFRTGAAAAFTAAALATAGPLLAVPILGPGWQMAGVLTAVFAIPLSLTMVALPATTLLIPLGRERLLVLLQSTRLAAILLTLIVMATFSDDLLIICVVTSVVWTLAYVPLLLASFSAAQQHDRASSQ